MECGLGFGSDDVIIGSTTTSPADPESWRVAAADTERHRSNLSWNKMDAFDSASTGKPSVDTVPQSSSFLASPAALALLGVLVGVLLAHLQKRMKVRGRVTPSCGE